MKIEPYLQTNNLVKKFHITADAVLQNRLEVCKTLIKKKQFSQSVYASYFELPMSKVKEDVESLGYKLEEIESDKPISFEALSLYRRRVLEKDSSKETLAKLGMWHMPTKEKETVYRYQDENTDIRLQSALEYYQNERLIQKHGYSLVADKFSISFKELKDMVVENNLKRIENSIVDKYREDLKELLNNSTATSVSKLTGIPQARFYDLSREASREYQDTHSNLLGEHTPLKSANRKEHRRETIWNMYNAYGSANGYTQQEIADQLGITRATVINDIKAYKKEHPDVIDVTQLYRARHSGLEKALNRIEKKAIAASLYAHGNSLASISKELHTNVETVKTYLIEGGYIEPYAQEKYKETPVKEDVSLSAETGFQHKGQFTEGKMYGATSYLLQQKNAPSPSDDLATRKKMGKEILNNQRQTMAAIRNDPVAYREFISKQGRMIDFMNYAELKRNNPQLESPDIGMEM